jgi:hypothetical protein
VRCVRNLLRERERIINTEYWGYADRRLKHLVEGGMVPAIVGACGRADCNAMKHVGVDGLKRHWRHLFWQYMLSGGISDDAGFCEFIKKRANTRAGSRRTNDAMAAWPRD